MRVKIHHEGTEILIVGGLVLAALNVPLWLWLHDDLVMIPMVVTAASIVFYLLVVNFFRSPRRKFTGDVVNAVVASADGKVVALEKVYEPEVLKCEAIQLSVFMSPTNVHANWFPVDGKVIYTAHHSGRFQAAWLPKSSTENERSTVVIETPAGQRVLMRQIAGAMARRIVTYAQPGTEANIEDHMGFIKFGSRVDLYLPIGTEIFVKLDDRTTGGVSLVGRLRPDLDPQIKA
ncbi:MAG: phosphatidylserine decarboxylase family protein [Muribaculaceae bacterium]|nr:phosphatidylserine decarboxylase family protein [Muribaculaceae bacterium]MDE6645388.1 phosphatidylserine decarboxylase family protein [Muribaculaceae bacterium]